MFRAAARELFGAEVPAGPLPLRALRNPDLRELVLEVDGRPALRFATAYGFRNIQMLVAPSRTHLLLVSVLLTPRRCLGKVSRSLLINVFLWLALCAVCDTSAASQTAWSH